MTPQTISTTVGTETKNRYTLAKFLAIILPLWLSAKYFNGPYMDFITTYFAAIILIILLALIFQFIFPKQSAKTVLIGLFLYLTLTEITYYFLPGLFSNLSLAIGGVNLVGGSFSINMVPYYGVGGFIGYFILQACRVKKS